MAGQSNTQTPITNTEFSLLMSALVSGTGNAVLRGDTIDTTKPITLGDVQHYYLRIDGPNDRSYATLSLALASAKTVNPTAAGVLATTLDKKLLKGLLDDYTAPTMSCIHDGGVPLVVTGELSHVTTPVCASKDEAERILGQ